MGTPRDSGYHLRVLDPNALEALAALTRQPASDEQRASLRCAMEELSLSREGLYELVELYANTPDPAVLEELVRALGMAVMLLRGPDIPELVVRVIGAAQAPNLETCRILLTCLQRCCMAGELFAERGAAPASVVAFMHRCLEGPVELQRVGVAFVTYLFLEKRSDAIPPVELSKMVAAMRSLRGSRDPVLLLELEAAGRFLG